MINVKIKNCREEYVTGYWYNRGQFSGYEFTLGKFEDAININEDIAKIMISNVGHGFICCHPKECDLSIVNL